MTTALEQLIEQNAGSIIEDTHPMKIAEMLLRERWTRPDGLATVARFHEDWYGGDGKWW